MISNLVWQAEKAAREKITQLAQGSGTVTSSPLTCYSWDSDLPAAAAFPSLSKWFDLDDVILIGGQSQLYRSGVGFHDVGAAVSILLVQHLRTRGGNNYYEGSQNFDIASDNFEDENKILSHNFDNLLNLFIFFPGGE